MRPEELLICRIFEQAIEDYKDLKEKNIEIKKGNGTGYSFKDIERFFGSTWCARLLDMIDCNLTGSEILNRVKVQCA